jgi:uncharacterized protein (TIGR03000 family)
MLRKWSLVCVLGSFALLFVSVDMAQAQLRGMRERRLERREVRREVLVQPMQVPVMVDQSSSVRVSLYPTVTTEAQANVAQIRVILPDAQARVMFDDNATKQTGAERWFYTPPLTARVGNSYRIRVMSMQNGKEVTQERVLNVAPGMTYVLDFSRR